MYQKKTKKYTLFMSISINEDDNGIQQIIKAKKKCWARSLKRCACQDGNLECHENEAERKISAGAGLKELQSCL